jgi:hypothetical protein
LLSKKEKKKKMVDPQKETKVFKLLSFKIMISSQRCQYRTEVISLSLEK